MIQRRRIQQHLGNARIRRISLVNGVATVSTIAGSGVSGTKDGPGNIANGPIKLCECEFHHASSQGR